MARSAALGLTLGGIGTVAIISGIQGKSIAEVLKGELGPAPNPAFGTNTHPFGEGLAKGFEEGALGGISGEVGPGKSEATGPQVSNPQGPGRERAEKGKPPSPSVVGNVIAAQNYEAKLKEEIENKRITSAEAIKKFEEHFPHYEKERLEVLGK